MVTGNPVGSRLILIRNRAGRDEKFPGHGPLLATLLDDRSCLLGSIGGLPVLSRGNSVYFRNRRSVRNLTLLSAALLLWVLFVSTPSLAQPAENPEPGTQAVTEPSEEQPNKTEQPDETEQPDKAEQPGDKEPVSGVQAPAGWEKRLERQEDTEIEITQHLPHVPPDLESYKKLGRHWHVKGGGYVHLDFISDFGEHGDSFAFTPSAIPVDGNGPDPQHGLLRLGNSFRAEARRTRLRASFYNDLPRFVEGTRLYVETDFYGPNGEPRLRHAFVAWPYLVFGRTDSAFKDTDAEPETVDFSGPNATFGSRQQGVRVIVPISSYRLAVALEDTGGVITPSGFRELDEGLERRPDITFHFRANEDWGHLQLSGIIRRLVTDEFGGSLQRFQGNGLAFSGQVFTQGKDSFQFEVVRGDGLGSRVQDLGGTLSEVGLDRRGVLDTQTAWGGFVAYQHWWDETTRSTAYLSHVKVELRDGQPADSYEQGSSAAVNVIRSLSQNMTVGAELMVGRRANFGGAARTVGRGQVMLRYSF